MLFSRPAEPPRRAPMKTRASAAPHCCRRRCTACWATPRPPSSSWWRLCGRRRRQWRGWKARFRRCGATPRRHAGSGTRRQPACRQAGRGVLWMQDGNHSAHPPCQQTSTVLLLPCRRRTQSWAAPARRLPPPPRRRPRGSGAARACRARRMSGRWSWRGGTCGQRQGRDGGH